MNNRIEATPARRMLPFGIDGLLKKSLFWFFKGIVRTFWFISKPLGKIAIIQRLTKFLIVRLKPTTVNIDGHVFTLNRRDAVFSFELLLRGYEKSETGFFDSFIQPGCAFIDIGAHVGFHTLRVAKKAGPDGRVFSFEADRENFELLTKNIRTNGYDNVVAVNKAVSDRVGKIAFFQNPENSGANKICGDSAGKKTVEIDATTIDGFFASEMPRDVKLIKMDIEGAEFAAFKGMRRLLDANPDAVVFSEFWPFGLRALGYDAGEYLDAIINAGFIIFLIDEDTSSIFLSDKNAILAQCVKEKAMNIVLMKKDHPAARRLLG
jgi:FkbM family methyltransferase